MTSMKKSLIALAALSACAAAALPRARTHDVSFSYRMGAGFAGDVNRTHPSSIKAGMMDATDPPRFYGDPCLFSSTGAYRGVLAADQSDSVPINVVGVVVRAYPVQASSAAGAYGQQALSDTTSIPTDRAQDFLELGHMMVQVRGAGPTSVKQGDAVYVFASADESGHKLGGFETAAISGKTVLVKNARYCGPADANGIIEVEVWPSNTIS